MLTGRGLMTHQYKKLPVTIKMWMQFNVMPRKARISNRNVKNQRNVEIWYDSCISNDAILPDDLNWTRHRNTGRSKINVSSLPHNGPIVQAGSCSAIGKLFQTAWRRTGNECGSVYRTVNVVEWVYSFRLTAYIYIYIYINIYIYIFLGIRGMVLDHEVTR